MAYFIYSRKCKASKNHKITFLLPNREGKKTLRALWFLEITHLVSGRAVRAVDVITLSHWRLIQDSSVVLFHLTCTEVWNPNSYKSSHTLAGCHECLNRLYSRFVTYYQTAKLLSLALVKKRSLQSHVHHLEAIGAWCTT